MGVDARVDEYLATLDAPKAKALAGLRRTILELVPDAEECISCGLPAYQVEGKTIAGFAAFRHHLSFLPHSGSVLDKLGDDVAGYQRTKGALHFPADRPLPRQLVERLLTTRLAEAGLPPPTGGRE